MGNLWLKKPGKVNFNSGQKLLARGTKIGPVIWVGLQELFEGKVLRKGRPLRRQGGFVKEGKLGYGNLPGDYGSKRKANGGPGLMEA